MKDVSGYELRAKQELALVLGSLGFSVRSGVRSDLDAELDGRVLRIEVKPLAYATADRVRSLVAGSKKRSGVTTVVVCDKLTNDARDVLRDHGWGWLDRRGHVVFRGPGVVIDADVQPLFAPRAEHPPIAGLSGRAVAYALLIQPGRRLSVRGSVPELGVSPAAISTALKRLREAGLVDPSGHAVTPDLFWALAEHWQTDRVWLDKAPLPSIPEAKSSDLDETGWCLTGAAAAAEWNAPVVSVAPTSDLYVPGPVVISIALQRYGRASNPSTASASIAVAPVSMITRRRHRGRKWALAHPLAVALDLAQDIGRGREILQDWHPPMEFERVWA